MVYFFRCTFDAKKRGKGVWLADRTNLHIGYDSTLACSLVSSSWPQNQLGCNMGWFDLFKHWNWHRFLVLWVNGRSSFGSESMRWNLLTTFWKTILQRLANMVPFLFCNYPINLSPKQRILRLWMIPPTAYGIYVFFFTEPVIFSGTVFSWFFNPHLGYLEDKANLANFKLINKIVLPKI